MTHRIRSVVLLAVVALALGGCAAPASDTAPTSTPTPTPVSIPATAVGTQAQWVLDEINASEGADAATVEARFDPAVLEQVGVEDLQAVFDDLRAAAPWTPTGYEGTETQAVVAIQAGALEYEMSVSVGADQAMTGLLFGPPAPERTPAANWDELERQIDDAPFTVTLAVSGADERVIGPDEQAPLGSIFKLYVLAAVTDAVAAGTLGWDDPLVVDAAVKSLPSGEMQNLPDGTEVTVRDAAAQMIAISDNTATDLLIRAVGHEAVEQAMAGLDHSDPERNTPFLTTREMFWLLFGDDALRARWAAAGDDVAAREATLELIPAGVPAIDAQAEPGWEDGIDWFATPADIAAAHRGLQERAQTDAGAPLRDILSQNPGIEFGDTWEYVAFKGGSSLGVMAGSWYLEGPGDVVISVFARGADAAALADPRTVFGWVQDAAALVADGL